MASKSYGLCTDLSRRSFNRKLQQQECRVSCGNAPDSAICLSITLPSCGDDFGRRQCPGPVRPAFRRCNIRRAQAGYADGQPPIHELYRRGRPAAWVSRTAIWTCFHTRLMRCRLDAGISGGVGRDGAMLTPAVAPASKPFRVRLFQASPLFSICPRARKFRRQERIGHGL